MNNTRRTQLSTYTLSLPVLSSIKDKGRFPFCYFFPRFRSLPTRRPDNVGCCAAESFNGFLLKSSGSRYLHSRHASNTMPPQCSSTEQYTAQAHHFTLVQALRDAEGRQPSSQPESETIKHTLFLSFFLSFLPVTLTSSSSSSFSFDFAHLSHTADSSAEPGYQ